MSCFIIQIFYTSRESIIEEEDEEDEDEKDQDEDEDEDEDEEQSRSGSTSSLEQLLSSMDKKITRRGSKVGVDKEKGWFDIKTFMTLDLYFQYLR